MIGRWLEKLNETQRMELDYILYKCQTRPQICSSHELIIKTMAELLEQIHFAMAPLSDQPEFAIETKQKIKGILGYD